MNGTDEAPPSCPDTPRASSIPPPPPPDGWRPTPSVSLAPARSDDSDADLDALDELPRDADRAAHDVVVRVSALRVRDVEIIGGGKDDEKAAPAPASAKERS